MTEQPFQQAKSHRRTHCKQGHPLEGENLVVYCQPGTRYRHRSCRICNNARARATYARNREALKDRWRKYPDYRKKKAEVTQ